jgi:hypothetical protein
MRIAKRYCSHPTSAPSKEAAPPFPVSETRGSPPILIEIPPTLPDFVQCLYLRLESKDVGEDNNSLLKPYELILSTDPLEVFRYLGCDVQKYLDGFDTKMEMVKFLCRTRFFRPYVFRPSKANYGSRKR